MVGTPLPTPSLKFLHPTPQLATIDPLLQSMHTNPVGKQVMLWWMVSLVMPMVRLLQVMLPFTVLLVMMMVRVL